MQTRNPYGVTDEQIAKCEDLLSSGFESLSKQDAKEIAKSNVRDYMDWRRDSLERGHKLTYRSKLDKLQLLIDACIPNNVASLIKNAESVQDAVAVIKVGLAALHESNLMQGHQAAEKYVTATVSFDTTDFKKNLSDLRERFKDVW